jgi:hypothetical protein
VKKLRRKGIADVEGRERVSRTTRVLGRPQPAIRPGPGVDGRLSRGGLAGTDERIRNVGGSGLLVRTAIRPITC